jgi:ubiquinone/menaquinone biosynthesis C-methylase UbiE
MQPKNKETAANNWDQYRCPTGEQGREVAKKMNQSHWNLTTWGLRHVKVEADAKVLDVGCGGGKTLKRLAIRAGRGKVFGIDISQDMVDYAKKVNQKLIAKSRIQITKAMAEKTGFKDQTFDLVTAIETYYFWPSLPEAFRELKRILKPNGALLIISEMVQDGTYEKENAKTIAETHVQLLPLKEISDILLSLGFTNVQTKRKSKSTWNAILATKAK